MTRAVWIDRIANRVANWRFSIANWILAVLYVDQAVGYMVGSEIDIKFPVQRIAELEGRHSLCIDDVEEMKQALSECISQITELKAKVERLEMEEAERGIQ